MFHLSKYIFKIWHNQTEYLHAIYEHFEIHYKCQHGSRQKHSVGFVASLELIDYSNHFHWFDPIYQDIWGIWIIT